MTYQYEAMVYMHFIVSSAVSRGRQFDINLSVNLFVFNHVDISGTPFQCFLFVKLPLYVDASKYIRWNFSFVSWYSCTVLCSVIFGPRREKTCLRVFANNTGADQPAHPRSLVSAFVIRFLESTICKLATGEISIF